MRAVAWNCQGVRNKVMVRHVKELMTTTTITLFVSWKHNSTYSKNLIRRNNRLGFSYSYMFGFAGGILLICDPNNVNLQVMPSTTQAIHTFIGGRRNPIHLYFGYIRPYLVAKDLFWNDCKGFSYTMGDPLIFLRGFNDIGVVDKHWGSNSVKM